MKGFYFFFQFRAEKKVSLKWTKRLETSYRFSTKDLIKINCDCTCTMSSWEGVLWVLIIKVHTYWFDMLGWIKLSEGKEEKKLSLLPNTFLALNSVPGCFGCGFSKKRGSRVTKLVEICELFKRGTVSIWSIQSVKNRDQWQNWKAVKHYLIKYTKS